MYTSHPSRTKKGGAEACSCPLTCVCVCVWEGVMDGGSISQCMSPPCPDQIDGRVDHVPFAHKALPLRCPLISKRRDGEPDQWVYFGKRVGDCQCIIPGLCWAMLLPKKLKEISKAVVAVDNYDSGGGLHHYNVAFKLEAVVTFQIYFLSWL